ncbi:hypothetical protein CORC01_04027 [Colletotrichum orchidophilum]|uniref:Uncharacterized protein n=1 Tax=Colletotrichum orchidophilum TaxID=1209926 RepID=A0A1G4BGT6_9PEZI|nr:uncharacterized protein CORC01_04027 [Colletotrichum orchidophilum]OHF00710.1 hypothetical protein CORC01_04027 [Colletotrichum orchidophilum]
MISSKPFFMLVREVRVLYWSCLSCVVILVVFFSYNSFPHFDIHSIQSSGKKTSTQTKPEDSSIKSGGSNEDGMFDHGSNKNETLDSERLKELKYAIILPTYSDHIPLAIEFLQSYMCLCTDHSDIDFHVVVSDSNEVTMFQDAMKKLKSCGPSFSIFPTPPMNINGPKPNINIINFFDILPPVFHSMTTGKIMGNDTSAVLKERGKYQYQTIKKMAAAAAVDLDYDYALWLDSEAIAVQPFSMRQTFDTYVKAPTIWRSQMTNDDFMRKIIGSAADVLDRSLDSFGSDFWNLESNEWIFEKAVFNDMVQYVEKVHKQDFWTAWVTHGGPFEVNLYNMHIQARKLETTDPLFTKYRIIETEREMAKFGMIDPAKAVIDAIVGHGLLEVGYKLLAVPEIGPKFSSLLNEYGERLLRFEDLDVGPPEVVDRFLLDTPIYMLCSGAPPLHSWWEKRKKIFEPEIVHE